MWIYNTRIVNFLGEHGLFPAIDCGEQFFFKKSAKLFSLLQSYTVKYSCIPNRL